MRLSIAAAIACLSLAACGGSNASQANNAQANMSTHAMPAATATGSAVKPGPVQSVSGAEATRIMHERHEGMEAIGKANKAIRDQLQGSSPDLGVILANGAKIAALAEKADGWFPQGTGPEAGKTGAKPEIWQNPQDFAAKLTSFQSAAHAFEAAAATRNVATIKLRLGPLGDACKACHDKYRSKMHH